MTLQYNTQPGGLMYAPSRDIRYCGVVAVKEAVRRFNNRMWPDLDNILEQADVSDGELAEAVDAYQRFLVTACNNPEETFHAVLKRSGWLDCKAGAHVAFMAMIGVAFSGMLFKALRDTTPLGEQAALDIRDLAIDMETTYRLLTGQEKKTA